MSIKQAEANLVDRILDGVDEQAHSKESVMYNPNTLSQLAAAVADDLQFLGLLVANQQSSDGPSAYEFFEVGNQSITLVKVHLRFDRRNGKAYCQTEFFKGTRTHHTVTFYDGELESFCRTICSKIVSQALQRRAVLGI